MRFAYIDSQGKEVGIPSVEALQLRIELGAIGPETEFYDANADRWAPAGEHELFRSLKRELEERDDGSFVAPPPPSLGGVSWPGEDDEEPVGDASPGAGAAEPEGDATADADAESTGEAAGVSEVPEPAKPRAPNPFAAEEGPDAEATLDQEKAAAEAADGGTGGAAEDEAAEEESEFDFGGFGGLELADDEDAGSAATDAAADEEPMATDEDGDGFPDLTFTDPGDGFDEEAEEPGPSAGAPEPDDEGEDSTFDFGGGLELEESFADQHGGAADEDAEVAPSGMELEEPLSDYDGDEPPSWMDDGEEDGGLELESAATAAYADPDDSWKDEEEAAGSFGGDDDFGGDDFGGDDAGDDDFGGDEGYGGDDDRGDGARGREGGGDDPEGEGAGRRRAPKARPAAPRPSSSGFPVGLVVLVLVVAGGGFFGWRAMSGGSEPAVPEDPPVEIPQIPAYLESTFGEAAEPAYAGMLDSLRSRARGLPVEPSDDWLGGVYLANASRYEGIQRYWEAVGAWLTAVRASDEDIFMERFATRLDSLDIQGDDREALLARARAGFQSSQPDRREIYDQLDALVSASLGLHDFLLANEQAIDYEPAASGLSRDPVTEAVPATDELGDQMWDRVGDITAALDTLGALDRVTTERLLEILFRKLSGTSID